MIVKILKYYIKIECYSSFLKTRKLATKLFKLISIPFLFLLSTL